MLYRDKVVNCLCAFFRAPLRLTTSVQVDGEFGVWRSRGLTPIAEVLGSECYRVRLTGETSLEVGTVKKSL
jgi:hypothetical protein